jgi:RmlD substrate binding domain
MLTTEMQLDLGPSGNFGVPRTKPQELACAPQRTSYLQHWRPWAVVNAAGYGNVDEAERQPNACARANTLGPATLAAACTAAGIGLVTFSSALVFDGKADEPYVESSKLHPLSTYGRCKAAADVRVNTIMPQALIVRTQPLFGPWDSKNFLSTIIRDFRARRRLTAADDLRIFPTYDQVGNRAFGTRLSHEIGVERCAIAAMLLLFLPTTPLLFMGQEWAPTSPFLYFTDHDGEVGDAVTKGRRKEFEHFAAFSAPGASGKIPDRQAYETFARSKLLWKECDLEPHGRVLTLHRDAESAIVLASY